MADESLILPDKLFVCFKPDQFMKERMKARNSGMPDRSLSVLAKATSVLSVLSLLVGSVTYAHPRYAAIACTLFEQKGIGHFATVWCADAPVVKPAPTFILQQIAALKR